MTMSEGFKPRAAIFDMDGLMLDTEGPMIPLWIEAGRQIGRDIKEETPIHTIGLNSGDIRQLTLNELGCDFPYDEFRNILRKLANDYFEKNLAHKQGLLPLLDHLTSLQMPLAVATSSRREGALKKLEQAGIKKYFSAFACGDDVKLGKPAPDIFLKAVELLGVLPQQCVGLEDSPAGLQGLYNAGIRSIFVKDLIEPPADVLATVWKRCDNLKEVIGLF